MTTIKEQEFKARIDKQKWSWWEATKVADLATLTYEQIEFLFYKHGYGYPQSGDWYVAYLTGEKQKQAIHRYHMDVLKGESCRYCKCIFYQIAMCPKLIKKQQKIIASDAYKQ